MERSVAVLACLLLVVSVAAVPPQAGSARSTTEPHAITATPPMPSDNTTARLTLPDSRVERSGPDTVRIGMGSALQAESDHVRYQHYRLTVERRFEATGSIDEKRTVIDRTLIDLRDRLDALAARERAVIRNYSNGTITGETLARELAYVDASAREIEAVLNVLQDLAASRAITLFEGRVKGVQFQAESLQGPVRHRVTRTLAGNAPATRVFVTTSDTGVVLSTLVGDTYVREATDYRYRRLDEPNAVDSARALAKELYPWAWNESGYHGVEGALTANIYRIVIPHSQGELVAFVDTGSADVFHEVQTFSVSNVPTTSTINRSDDGLRVTLHRTFEGGPLHVYVEDATTGAVVNAAVTVGEHELGRTGTDGHVRTIEPRGEYTVNVSGDEAALSVVVDPDESEG